MHLGRVPRVASRTRQPLGGRLEHRWRLHEKAWRSQTNVKGASFRKFRTEKLIAASESATTPSFASPIVKAPNFPSLLQLSLQQRPSLNFRAVTNVGPPCLLPLFFWPLYKHFLSGPRLQSPDLVSWFFRKLLPACICENLYTCGQNKNCDGLTGGHVEPGSLFQTVFSSKEISKDIGRRNGDFITSASNLLANYWECLCGS